MMEHLSQPLDLRPLQSQQLQQQQQQQQISGPSHTEHNPTVPINAMSHSLAMEAVHPFQTAPPLPAIGPFSPAGISSDGMAVQAHTTASQSTFPSRPLWFDNSSLTHRASFHSLLSAGGKDERLRARQDRGSIISLASTVGDDSPSEFSALDLEPSLDMHSQQGSTGMSLEGEEYDHQGIGTGLAMMSFLEFMPTSHSSPGETSVDGDLSSTQPSRSNSVMLDPSTAMKVSSMFDMGEEPLRLQPEQYPSSATAHPLSKEMVQHQDSSRENAARPQTMAPGQHPNETEGMLPPMWSGPMDMLAASVHPFSIPPYLDQRGLTSPPNSALLENGSNQDRESLARQVLKVYEQDGARPEFQASMAPYSGSPIYFDGNNSTPRNMNDQLSMSSNMTDGAQQQ
ncbi:hypothetical protein EDD11_003780, partial [Mortierella claussenii]